MTPSIIIQTIKELRAEIWQAAGRDQNRVAAAVNACQPREDSIAYWQRVLLHLQSKPEKKKAKPRKQVPEEFKARYTKAYHDYQAANFPNWVKDGHTIDPPPLDTGVANGLTRFICNYITWTGGRATRITTEGRSIEKDGKAIRIPTQTRKGTADISSTINGKAVMWEVKTGRDKPSDAQLREQARERRAGGEYFFTHDVEEFFSQYDTLVRQKQLF